MIIILQEHLKYKDFEEKEQKHAVSLKFAFNQFKHNITSFFKTYVAHVVMLFNASKNGRSCNSNVKYSLIR